MNKKKLNKKELFFSIVLPVMIATILVFSFLPDMENYWLRLVIIIGIMAPLTLILSLGIRWCRSRRISRNSTYDNSKK